jgi:glycosyltransferase involved in cell wall biosynthesis
MNKKIKILMTADAIGGVWTYVVELVKGLLPFDFEIVLAVMGSPPSRSQHYEMCCNGNVTILYKPFRLEWMENSDSDIQDAGEWLLSLQDTYDIDLVHINGYSNVALFWKCPVVCVAHSCVYSWYSHVKNCLPDSSWDRYKKRVCEAMVNADTVISPSFAMQRDLIKFYVNIKKTNVIYNGRSDKHFGTGKKEPLLFASGRTWDDAKNLKCLSGVAKNIEWPLYIAGDTGLSKLDEKYLGCLDMTEMIKWFNKASIYIHPALYEPFGLSVLEAAHCGCALVLGDIPSLNEIWENSAIYVNPRSPEDIQEKILYLIQDNEALSYYAEKAKVKAKLYTSESMCRNYVNVYKELLLKNSRIQEISSREKCV